MDTEKKISDSKTDNLDILAKNDDLSDLLNEAKSTIIQLQEETKSLKSEIDVLRQRNQEYVKTIQSNNDIDAKPKSPLLNNDHTSLEIPPPIPLEPFIIVKENKIKNHPKSGHNDVSNQATNNVRNESNYSEKSLASEETSQSDDTFVV